MIRPFLIHDIHRFCGEILRIQRLLPPADFAGWLGCLAGVWPSVLASRSLNPVDDAFPKSFRVRFGSSSLHFEQASFSLVREIFGSCCYASPQELRREKKILDLGANAGVFSVFALASAPDAEVYAVEAQPALVTALRENIARNGFAARFQATAAVVAGGWDSWTRRLLESQPGLPVFDPEEFFKKQGDWGFCKCDIEGAEFHLLQSRPSWLTRIRRLVLEYHGDWTEGERLGEILRESGFLVKQSGHGRLGYLRCQRT